MKNKTEIPKPLGGAARIWKAFFYSMAGLKHGILNEAAVRQEVILACILLPLTLLIPVSPLLKLLLMADMLAVLITELLNSAIEAVVDMTSPEYHPLAKQAKDMGSAAVLLSLVNLTITWAYALYVIGVGI